MDVAPNPKLTQPGKGQSQPSDGLGWGENIKPVLEVKITSFEKYFVNAEILL
jgi:hypothetical protein